MHEGCGQLTEYVYDPLQCRLKEAVANIEKVNELSGLNLWGRNCVRRARR